MKYNLIEEKMLKLFCECKYITYRLYDDEATEFFEQLNISGIKLHVDNEIRKRNAHYCYETSNEFGFIMVKDRNTNKVKSCFTMFPYTKIEFFLEDNDEIYTYGNGKITKKYLFLSIKKHDFWSVFCVAISFCSAYIPLFCMEKGIARTLFALMCAVCFILSIRIELIPKKQENDLLEKQNAYIKGIKSKIID